MKDLKALLKKMTLPEKIGQLAQMSPWFILNAGENDAESALLCGSLLGVDDAAQTIATQKKYLAHSRLGIPLLAMADVIHGYRTIFPVPLALASSWNPKLATLAARVSALEASTAGIHVTYSPMADLARDPRWGRVVEGFGEDPFLTGKFAKAIVEGYQNGDLSQMGNIAACVKHFAGYGSCEGGRDYNTSVLSRHALQTQYLAGYRAAIAAGARMVMTAFNTIEGVPCTTNKYLLREVLRSAWGFKGVTVSDYASLKETVTHGTSADLSDAARQGLEAGLDIEIATSCYRDHLESLIREKKVKESLLDEAVLRILTLKRDLGLFDDPYKGASVEREKELVFCDGHLAKTLEVAKECAVLLKNDGTLPLSKKTKVALIGPYATSRSTNGPWSWHGRPDDNKNLKEAFESHPAELLFVKNAAAVSELDDPDITALKKADVVVLALGEDENRSGEAHSYADLRLPGKQQELLTLVQELGKKAVVVLTNGRPLILNDLQSAEAILETWFLGSMASDAIVDLLYGQTNPSGRLTMSFPRSVGQIPIYHDHLPTGRPDLGPDFPSEFISHYMDLDSSPLYPFGFGLSYADFHHHDFSLDKTVMKETDTLKATVLVTNRSAAGGFEVVQLYLSDPVARVSRPVQELIGFQKIWVGGNQTVLVSFDLRVEDLAYFLPDGTRVFDKGKFTLMEGPDSTRLQTIDFYLG